MGQFVTFCGKDFEKNHDCFMTGVVIQQIYPPEMRIDSHIIADKCKACAAEKRECSIQRINLATGQPFITKEMVCFAKNKEFQEYPVLPVENDTPTHNLRQKMKIEYVFQAEDYRAILFREDVSIATSFFENIEDDLEELYDIMPIEEDDIHYLKMISMVSGRVEDIPFDNLDDFKNTLISARLVEYASEIIERNEKIGN